MNLFAQTLAAFGTIDVLVNNAADLRRMPYDGVSEELIDYQLKVNVKAPMLYAQKAGAIMRAKGSGSIINVTTPGALRAHLPSAAGPPDRTWNVVVPREQLRIPVVLAAEHGRRRSSTLGHSGGASISAMRSTLPARASGGGAQSGRLHPGRGGGLRSHPPARALVGAPGR